MPEIDALTKSDRFLQIQVLMLRNRQGLRTAEIARIFDVSERTARRYMDQLTASGRLPAYRDGRYWKLVQGARFDLLPVRLELNEAAVLYLAVRLLAYYSDKYNPHVRGALLKLASALPEDMAGRVRQTVLTLVERRGSPEFLEVFETVVQGWAIRRKVRLWHCKLQATQAREYLLSPYILEPSALGYATYAIGYSEPPRAMRTFKLERVQQAELTDQPFAVPENFDWAAVRRYAWHIMYSDGEPVEVRLRFSGRVARRVKESEWHPSQEIADLPDGGCEWKGQIAEVIEMVPWIRGWGADCEVLAPKELREQLAGEARRLAGMYGWKVEESEVEESESIQKRC